MAETLILQGVQKCLSQLKGLERAGVVGLSRGIKKGGLKIQRESQLIVPIDTSALKNSARTTFEKNKKGGKARDSKGRFVAAGLELVAVVSYETAYAIYVHEDLYAKHAPGKTAKYLERVFKEKDAEISKVIVDEIKRNLKV